MKVAIRTDVTSAIGAGHFSRCLALADALSRAGATSTFLSASGAAGPLPSASPHGARALKVGVGRPWADDAAATLAALEPSTHWVIVDHYGLDVRWERTIRDAGYRILVIEDLLGRTHACDVLLDQTYCRRDDTYSGQVPPECILLLGSSFALLRSPFEALHGTSARPRPPFRVHLFLGSGPPDSALPRLACLLLDSFPEIQVSAVGRADGSRMNTAISRFAGRLEWQPVVTDMAAHMSACNVAIGSPGVATWERACIGLPAVTLATNANQRSILRDLDRDGFARFLGDLEALSDEAFVDGVRHFLGDNDALDRYREIGVNAIDGRGALRAAQTMAMVVQSD